METLEEHMEKTVRVKNEQKIDTRTTIPLLLKTKKFT